MGSDFETVKSKYIDVIERSPGMKKYVLWEYGKHPTDEMLREYIERGEMYVLTDGENIAGMVPVIMHQTKDYENIAWSQKLGNDEVAALHLLAVCSGYRKNGIGTIIVQKAIELAEQNGKKAVRLDALGINAPAHHLYEKNGFSCRDKKKLYYDNTGWADFLFFEKLLPNKEENMRNWDEQAEIIMTERFGKDTVIALATAENNIPYVRNVNAYYENGVFYIITYALSNKMKQIKENPNVAITGEWFTAHGEGINLGFFGKSDNAKVAGKLRTAFAEWIDNGHNDFSDENTIILCVKLTDAVLLSHGTRYEF